MKLCSRVDIYLFFYLYNKTKALSIKYNKRFKGLNSELHFWFAQ